MLCYVMYVCMYVDMDVEIVGCERKTSRNTVILRNANAWRCFFSRVRSRLCSIDSVQELVQKPVTILFLEIVSMLLLFHPAWWAHETCGCRASLEGSLRWDVAAALFMALWHSFQIGRALHRATIDLSSPCCCAGNSGKRVVGMWGWFQSRWLKAQIAKCDVAFWWILWAPVLSHTRPRSSGVRYLNDADWSKPNL